MTFSTLSSSGSTSGDGIIDTSKELGGGLGRGVI